MSKLPSRGGRLTNKKVFPSGRNTGQRSAVSCLAVSGWRTCVTAPPSEEIRLSGPVGRGANTMTPRLLHVAPRPSGAEHSTSEVPPATDTFLSLSWEKKPRLRLSGDQNGPSAPSVPSSARADREFNGRTQSRLVLVESRATNASRRPSGETAEFAGSSSKTIFAGGNTENSAVGGVWLTATRDARKTTSAREKMPTPVRRRRRPRDESRGLRTDSSAAA